MDGRAAKQQRAFPSPYGEVSLGLMPFTTVAIASQAVIDLIGSGISIDTIDYVKCLSSIASVLHVLRTSVAITSVTDHYGPSASVAHGGRMLQAVDGVVLTFTVQTSAGNVRCMARRMSV